MQQEFAPDGEDPPEQLAGEVAGQLASRRSSDVPPSETVRRASAGAATSAMRTAWASIGCEGLSKVEQSEEEINPDQLYPARVGPSVRTWGRTSPRGATVSSSIAGRCGDASVLSSLAAWRTRALSIVW